MFASTTSQTVSSALSAPTNPQQPLCTLHWVQPSDKAGFSSDSHNLPYCSDRAYSSYSVKDSAEDLIYKHDPLSK